ncbi:hypothetical protein VOLCADRAFT_107652 [Volvox carteri f. nagariensis]|uniref:Pherophorin domain-containing protein n=1 Tax=Volvox carteri f. nagariensis TaxID=3068 RepID=D8UFF0_VOLCA|nr:uncharacterized protein VOLCADRAFT_107652 [Volvox carteri f. nagariensis]EFJ41559.1 hypothetical protein VOLCADRAFT_107652 [Volvox carteri f. nagariensis]|eukprot:XP_002957350.1 hypothetical protein VOLCADRAFT_107652 [Volvox carteri f. nagariensis]
MALRVVFGILLLVLVAQQAAAGGSGGKERRWPKELKEDFQFELRNIYSNRQNGSRYNFLTKYRYPSSSEAFDFHEAEEIILKFVPAGGMGIPGNAFTEVLSLAIAKALWAKFNLVGLSFRIEVQGMSSDVRSHYASTVTVGDIEPWVSLVNNFPGCDGMDTDEGNKACRVYPILNGKDRDLAATAAKKAGKHDKPKYCDFCG